MEGAQAVSGVWATTLLVSGQSRSKFEVLDASLSW